MVVRLAIALGYLGRDFSGSQVQPRVRTVQGELEAALITLTWCAEGTHPVSFCSRTDAGVDAHMNIASFDLAESIWEKVGEYGVITALNDQIGTDVRVFAAHRMAPDFRTRNAVSRSYLYRLQAMQGWPTVSQEALAVWCDIFVGEHDFLNFCRPIEGRQTIKRVLVCKPWLDAEGGVLGFEIEAEGFVWNQVRRIASAILGLAQDRLSIEEVKRALSQPEVTVNFGRSEAEWLTLWSIHHAEASGLVPDGFDIPLIAEEQPRGRRYPLWMGKARNEQDILHRSAWLHYLS
jgi:tRNA pseudouridine38-40 synthase